MTNTVVAIAFNFTILMVLRFCIGSRWLLLGGSWKLEASSFLRCTQEGALAAVASFRYDR